MKKITNNFSLSFRCFFSYTRLTQETSEIKYNSLAGRHPGLRTDKGEPDVDNSRKKI